MSQSQEAPYQDWFIIFEDDYYRPHWLFRYLKPGFRHVYAIRRSSCGYLWIIVTSRFNHLDILLKSTNMYPSPRNIAGPDATILEVRAILNDDHQYGLCFYSCVEAVKAVLGVRKFMLWTPWQLHQYLRKSGDEFIRKGRCKAATTQAAETVSASTKERRG